MYLTALVSTNIGDPPSPGPIDAFVSSKEDLEFVPRSTLSGTIGAELVFSNKIAVQKMAIEIFHAVI